MLEPEWTYQGQPVTDELVAPFASFVYIITRLSTGRRYVGKKILKRKVTRAPLKGKTKKRHSTAESDWRSYWGSSDELKADITEHGHQGFKREIVYLCETRGESSYFEARIQFVEDVLLKSDEWYNSSIMARIHRNHLPGNKKRR